MSLLGAIFALGVNRESSISVVRGKLGLWKKLEKLYRIKRFSREYKVKPLLK